MYNPAAVNDAANWIVFIAIIPTLFATISYGIMAPWYRTALGSILFSFLASVTSVLVFVLTRRLWGMFFGYEVIAFVVYSWFALSVTAFLVIFYAERRRAGLLELPLRRRD